MMTDDCSWLNIVLNFLCVLLCPPKQPIIEHGWFLQAPDNRCTLPCNSCMDGLAVRVLYC